MTSCCAIAGRTARGVERAGRRARSPPAGHPGPVAGRPTSRWCSGSHVLTYNGEIYNHRRCAPQLPGPWHSTRRHRGAAAPAGAARHAASRPSSPGCSRSRIWDAAGAAPDRSRATGSASSRSYYRILPDGIAFASELKALLVLGKPADRRERRARLSVSRLCPGAEDDLSAASAKLPAGHTLTWQDGRVRIERYWQPSTAIEARTRGRYAAMSSTSCCARSIPAHTLSDVPVGVFLSGGIDSALTAYYLDAPRTYSLGFDARDRSELEAARARRGALGHGAHRDDGAGRGFRAGARCDSAALR